MILCSCPRPARDTTNPDPLRCAHCGHWTPHGRPFSAERALVANRHIASLAGRITDDLAWLANLAHQPTRRPTPGRTPGHADPTPVAITNPRHQPTHAYTLIAGRALERAIAWLNIADTAAGEALLAAEPNRTPDHTPAPYHDPATLHARPDLQEALAAKHRRIARRDGWGTS